MTAQQTFISLLHGRVEQSGDALMLEDTAGRRLTFAGYAEAVASAAAAIDPAVPVAWQLPTTIDAAVLAGAVASAGGVQVPLLPVWRKRELAFAVDQVGAGVLVVPPASSAFDHPALADEIAAERPGLVTAVGSWPPPGAAAPGAAAPAPAHGPEGRWIFYTSGTTAEPKGVRHRDTTVINAARVMIGRYGLTAEDRHAVVFPFTHIGGIVWLVAGLMTGMPQLMVDVFHPEATIASMRSFGVTVAGAGTAFHQIYLQAQLAAGRRKVLPALRLFVGGGAPKPAALHRRMKEAFGVGIASSYGLTECPIVTINPPGGDDEKLSVSEGLPVTGATVVVVRSDGTPASPGEEGEVRLRALQMFEGYVDASLDGEAFDEHGRIRTGDLGYLDDDGYLVISGRIKDIIIRKGENISAKQVEDLLDRHPGVEEVAIVGIPDPDTGERAVAVVVAADPADPPTLEDLDRFLTEQGLMRQKHPEQLEIVPSLPRNPAGKVLKTDLRSRLATRSGG